MNEIDEKKLVTWEIFEKYHELLLNHIKMNDDLILNGETICPKCGATITSNKCENCSGKRD